MKNGDIKNRNVLNVVKGVFFVALSASIALLFLPFFLKEQGLSALEIGGLFTISIAIGSLLFSLVFSKILRRIKLSSGLFLSGIFNFFRVFFVYLFPNLGGAVASKVSGELYNPTGRISVDSTLQHNVKKGKEKRASSLNIIFEGTGFVLGVIISMILINEFGFRISFLVLSIFALPALIFYSKVNESTRFKEKTRLKLPKISKTSKTLLFSEIIYWFALASSFAIVITFLVSDKLSGTIFNLGALFIALYGSMSLTTYFTKDKFRKFNEIKISILGMSILFVSPILVILSSNFYVVLTAFILEGIGAGIWVPSKTSLLWKNTKKENREKVSGWLSGFRGFVQTLGPLTGGFLITQFGINYPFYLKAGICVVALSVYVSLLRKS